MVLTTDSPLEANRMSQDIADLFLPRSKRILQICDLLEALADDLPRRPAAVWREARAQVAAVLTDHFLTLTKAVLPALICRTQDEVDRKEILSRLGADFNDQVHRIGDLDELLGEALAPDTCQIGPEALGYALRDHFDSLRRHVRWETDVLWPMMSRILTRAEFGAVAKTFGPPVVQH